MGDQESRHAVEPSTKADELPVWRRPTFTVLDVEAGTVTTTGPLADGNGSTS